MSKNDFIRKLASRKFWAAVAGFVTSVMTLVNIADTTAVQVTSVITAAGVLISYIVSEGMTDASGAEKKE